MQGLNSSPNHDPITIQSKPRQGEEIEKAKAKAGQWGNGAYLEAVEVADQAEEGEGDEEGGDRERRDDREHDEERRHPVLATLVVQAQPGVHNPVSREEHRRHCNPNEGEWGEKGGRGGGV